MNLPNAFISAKCNVSEKQLITVKELLDEGATIPFIARYRKEKTSGLDEVSIDNIKHYLIKYNKIAERKLSIIKILKENNLDLDEVIKAIEQCWNKDEIEDLYLPYKINKKTKASLAIDAGLDSLAKLIISQENPVNEKQILQFKNSTFSSIEDIRGGALHILSKWISERKKVRYALRKILWDSGLIISKKKVSVDPETDIEKYRDYFAYEEPAKHIKSHRYLALQRGAYEGVLAISLKINKQNAIGLITSIIMQNQGSKEMLKEAIESSWSKLLKPSLEKELFQVLKEKSDQQAIAVFSENLRQLLLQPPVHGKRLLAIDPGYRSGCKLVCLTAHGDLLNNETIFPHAPQREIGMAKKKIAGLVEQYKLDAISIGNGTASRETERLIKSIRFNKKVNVYIVNEAGASVYSASSIARKEFPDYDVTVRGAISIGRRLIDPLSELVKIDPQSIGVGQYQHDVNQTMLKEKLDAVVVSAVNSVGVDLNTSSEYLLSYVSGIGPKIAENIVKYRMENGLFKNRLELFEVPKLGAKVFEQAAGFLRVKDGDNPLDNSTVHPEFYNELGKICNCAGVQVNDLIGDEDKINSIDWKQYYSAEFGEATYENVIKELAKPGRDPRKIIFQMEFDKDLKSIDDLEIGKIVPGIINNVTNFGAFVDIGIKENGLIHISNLCDEYVEDPTKVVKIHQHVKARVISIDTERKRIGLSLKDLE